jgi:hypothetical protein
MSHRRIAGFSVAYVVRTTIAAVVGILLLKFLVARVLPPGGQRLVQAV